MFDLFDGCGLFVIGVVVAFLLWGGCATGKKAAGKHFSEDGVYAEFQQAEGARSRDIAAAKEEARRRVEEAVSEVRGEEREILALENDVEFLESLAVPDENMEDDVVFSDANKNKVIEEFVLWANDWHGKEYGEALEAKREYEHFKKAAEERLKSLEKSIWNKVGISRPDDKIYRDYADKSAKAKEKHDRLIGKLQDEFFEAETKKAVDAIRRMMDGQHGDDGIRSVIKRAKNNAARLREEAEKKLGK